MRWWPLLLVCLAAHAQASLQGADIEGLRLLEVPEVVCRAPGADRVTKSLATPVDQGNARGEVVVLTRHGLATGQEHCELRSKGRRYPFERIISGELDGLAGDWAVGLIGARLDADVPRLRVRAVGLEGIERLALEGGRVHVARTAFDDASTGCEVHVPKAGLRDPADRDAVFVSACPMIAGKSGAPAIARVESGPAVVGIGLGYRFELGSGAPEWHQRVAVIRLIDADIEAAIRELSQTVQGE